MLDAAFGTGVIRKNPKCGAPLSVYIEEGWGENQMDSGEYRMYGIGRRRYS